jgi:hypothetical protein
MLSCNRENSSPFVALAVIPLYTVTDEEEYQVMLDKCGLNAVTEK